MSGVASSTDDFGPEDRRDVWAGMLGHAPGRFETSAEGPLSAAAEFGELGSIKLCKIAVGPHGIERSGAFVRRDDRGLLNVVFQLAGRSELVQDGRRLVLSPEQWTLYDASRPYRIHNPGPVQLLALLIPRDQLIDRRFDPLLYGLERLSFTAGLGKVICTFTRSLLEGTPIMLPESGATLGEWTAELVRLAILEHVCEYRAPPPAAIPHERIRAYVSQHLRDPRFSIGAIAAALNCSKRYLHKTFSRANRETLGQYIWNLRLDRCRTDLIEPRFVHRSITQIAFEWGFNSSAHFSRSFKAHFGMTASDYRAAAKLAKRDAGVPAPDERSGTRQQGANHESV